MEYFLNEPVYEYILKLLEDKVDRIISSATDRVALIADSAEADAVSVIAHIEPVQEGTGDPSPENIRPITGFTGLTVKRIGKNFIPIEEKITTSFGVTFTQNADGTIVANGTATGGIATLTIINTVNAGLAGLGSIAKIGLKIVFKAP